MAIILDRFDGGEVDFLSARDLGENQFQVFKNVRADHITKSVKSLANVSKVGGIDDSYAMPGQGIIEYRAEWDNSTTPRQVSTLYKVLARIVKSAGAWEINIHRFNTKEQSGDADTEFIDETTAKGGWERATSNRLVQGSSNITFTASTDRISGHANLANYEVGEIIRVFNTTDNNGYYTVKTKEPAANSVDVQEALTDEASVSAYLYPLPDISMFAIRGDLRVSNGNFYDDHASQWYGHIKRDFWGEVVGVAENLNETDFATHADWDVTGVADDSGGNCAFVFAGGTLNGTLIQTAANRAITAENSVGYSFTYTIAVTTAPDGDFTLVLSALSSASVSLPITAGTHTVYFTSAAAASTAAFTITAAETTSTEGSFTMDTVSLQRSRYGLNGGRYVAPPMQESYNAWKLQNQELVAPTIVLGSRVGDATSAANEVAIHIAAAHHADWPDKAVDVEWNARDRVTATFVFDHVQETALGKTSSGDVGVEMGTIVTAADARAFMVEVYTGAAQASWNRRITAIRLYYKFHDDPDWYEIVTLDINKGWSESELVFDDENTGYWCPIMAAIQHTETSDASGGSGTTLESDAHGLSIYDLIAIGSSSAIEPASMCSIVESQVTNTITLPAAAVNSLGVSTTYNSQDWCGGAASTTAVGTFYIPFTGEKAFTYFTNTGRAAKVKVPAIRWGACDTDGSKVLYGNIDTKDENEQTIRERSRVIETQPGTPDIALLSMSKDVGLYSGDEIISISYFNSNWWVLMERSVVVLQPGTLRELGRYNGVGSKWDHANAITPFGLCVADESAITLFPGVEELTLMKRKSYQSLTIHAPAMGYSMKRKRLFFVPDTRDATSIEVWIYSFETKSWSRENLSASCVYGNIVSIGCWGGPTVTAIHNEPEILRETVSSGRLSSLQLGNLFAGSDEAGEIKTKEYDNGTPYKNKILGKGYLTHYSGADITLEIFLDGSTSAFKTMLIDASSSGFKNVEIQLNVTAKLFSFSFECSNSRFEIEDFIVPDEEITVLD
ncbi:MAG: hypothetical protein E3J60_04600 [Dehalococcoidia bacterium]|nr:MAG: hypothetical protein E3J60_04600 [Dehalococcoidia bacterium]